MSTSRRGQLGWLTPELPSWSSDSWTNQQSHSELPSVGTVCYAARTNWPVGVMGNLLSPTQCGILRSRHRNQAGEEAALLPLVKVGESGVWFLSQAGVSPLGGVLRESSGSLTVRPASTESGSLWPLCVCMAPVILDHTGEQSWMRMQCGDLEGRTVYTWSFPSLSLPTQRRPSSYPGKKWGRGWERLWSSTEIVPPGIRRAGESKQPLTGQVGDGADLSEFLVCISVEFMIQLAHTFMCSLSHDMFMYDTTMPFVGYGI